jgi:hypothetical protein
MKSAEPMKNRRVRTRKIKIILLAFLCCKKYFLKIKLLITSNLIAGGWIYEKQFISCDSLCFFCRGLHGQSG